MYIVKPKKIKKEKVSPYAKTYYSGMGYAVGVKRRKVEFNTTKAKEIFKKGYNAGLKKMERKPWAYPTIKND